MELQINLIKEDNTSLGQKVRKTPASPPALAKYSVIYFIFFKNLGKDHELPISIQTLILKWIHGFIFPVLINKTLPLDLEELSFCIPAPSLAGHMTLRKSFHFLELLFHL